MSIELLPHATRSKIRSTQILTSLPQIVSELVQNSLDAGANRVDVGVKCEEWSCWVRDNGCGMSKEGLDILARGSEAGRYGSSKAYTQTSLNEVSTFGFRGEALASAADLSCLEISSRTSQSRETWSIISKNGKCLYNDRAVRWRRQTPGTVVCIRDAFFNLPVRRLCHPSQSRTLEMVRKDLEQVALVFPSVTFSLEDSQKAETESTAKGRVMTIPKTGNTLTTFRHVYGRALARHVEEIDTSSGEMKLQGFISMDGAHAKVHQSLYINRHLLAQCDLHRIIDNEFTLSTFMKHAYEEEGEMDIPLQPTRRSPRKAERRPVYVLNLSIPPRDLDNCLEPAKANVQLKDTQAAMSFLSSAIASFLVRNGFRTKSTSNRTGTRDEESTPPRKKRKIDNHSNEEVSIPRSRDVLLVENPSAEAIREPLNLNDLDIQNYAVSEGDQGEELVWRDPHTGQIFVVDQRTGNSCLRTVPQSNIDSENPGTRYTGRRTLPNPRPLTGAEGHTRSEDSLSSAPEWIQEALQGNDVYALTEPRIHALAPLPSIATGPSDGRNLCGRDRVPHKPPFRNGQRSCLRQRSEAWDSTYSPEISRCDRTQLRSARVINQVDRKFIACIIDSRQSGEKRPGTEKSHSSSLVLIDQHAADERVRVEHFLEQLCSGFLEGKDRYCGEVMPLAPPVPILLTRHEANRLTESKAFQLAFKRWGISFEDLDRLKFATDDRLVEFSSLHGSEDEEAYVQISVCTLPTTVGQKLLAGEDLRELVKEYLGLLETEGVSLNHEEPSDNHRGSFSWLRALRWCPRQLVNLINSKACRGAIMFNDTLSLEQCERLVQRMSNTAFPFQCAHGRPSLVPVANIGSSIDTCTSGRRRVDVDWAIWTLPSAND